MSGDVPTIPLYTDPNIMFETLAHEFQGLKTDFYWLFYLDNLGLKAAQVNSLRRSIEDSRGDFFNTYGVTGSWLTSLSAILDRYSTLLTLARIPLFLLVFLAIGVLLYYLFLIAGLMGRIRAAEVALFRSRGASLPQVGLVLMTEGLLIAVPAIILGPFVAQMLVWITGILFASVSGNTQLESTGITLQVFLMGAAAGLLAVLVFSLTTLGTARHGMVEFRRASARPAQMPFLHRYYIDLVILALISLMWWQFQSRGSFLIRPLQGEDLQIDFSLLLGPVLGIIAVGLVLFRVFPLLVRAIEWPLGHNAPVWLAQALRRLTRDPVPAGSLLVLLALATSLGVMGSTFTTTLERNQRERAAYEAGADFRILHSLGYDGITGELSVAQQVRALPMVKEATDVIRISESMIGIDPDSFLQVAWTRPDFSKDDLHELVGRLKPEDPAERGLLLPSDASHLRMWVKHGQISGSPRIYARLQDSQGLIFDVNLGRLDSNGWRQLEGVIEPSWNTFRRGRSSRSSPVAPFTLHTIWIDAWTGAGTGANSDPGVVFFDQLEAITPDGEITIASFQDLTKWHALEDPQIPNLYVLETSESVRRPNRTSAAFSWPGLAALIWGIRAGPPEVPLPVIVSPDFLPINQVEIGDILTIAAGTEYVRVQVIGTAKLFPTLDPRLGPFVIIDSESFIEYVMLRSRISASVGLESWVEADEIGSTEETLRSVIQSRGGITNQVYDARKMISSRNQDPLLVAGWGGLLALSFITVVLASASGLILYTYIDVRERSEEFAMLRTLGFSRLQVNGVLWFNLTLVVVLGILAGTWGGQLLGSALLPLLEIAEQGDRVVPSMILQTDWMALGIAYAIIILAALTTVIALAWAIARLDIQRLLRAGAG
jgi:hypothetical protein